MLSRSAAKPVAPGGYPLPTATTPARTVQVGGLGASATIPMPSGAVSRGVPVTASPIPSGTVVAGEKLVAPATVAPSPVLAQAAPRTASAMAVPSIRQARIISGQSVSTQSSTTTGTPMGTRSLVSSAVSPSPVTYSGSPVVASSAPVVVSKPAPTPVMRPNTTAGPQYTQNAYEVKHQDDPQLNNLKDLRKTCGLKYIPVNDGLQGLKAGAVDGKLAREQFLDAYVVVLQQHGVEVPSETVRNAVFDLFDRDDNNIVDMMELICGISLLCAGTEDDKINAVFNIFDENGDGFISMEEMFKFLTSVFKVVLTPNVMAVMNSMGVTVESAEDLASVTALECFKTADLNQDGKLSVTEFKSWFYAPRNDPSDRKSVV